MHTGVKQKTIRVEYTQADRFARMTPGYMLRAVQQIAMEHCDGIGFTVPALLEQHCVFVLAKLDLKIHRAPVQGETVILTTAAQAPKRIIYKRTVRFESPEGELLAEVDSRWTLINTQTRRITREIPKDMDTLLLPPEEDQGDITQKRVVCDKEEHPVYVTYSMTDTNCHANNTFYADWVCDTLAPLLIRGSEIRRLKLFYHREAKAGDTVRISSLYQDGVHYISGDIPGGRCFDAEAELTEPLCESEAPLPYYV